jgi:Protein of unknown function, DUF547
MRRTLLPLLLAMTALFSPPPAHAALDPTHAAWSALLARHVKLLDTRGSASRVDYAGFERDRVALGVYLAQLARVTPAELAALPRADQMALLINAYNAATIELILTEYPKHASIKDYGSLFRSAWQKPFVRLLGETLSLDQIEHEHLRGKRGYGEPRVHFAVNCASISCPMLREEAYVGARLDAQLDEQAVRFLSDRTRNRFEPAARRLALSAIFDWYGGDFAGGDVRAFLARYEAALGASPGALTRGRVELEFLAYDWRLNDVKTPHMTR